MAFLDYASTCPVVKYPQQLYRDVLGEGYFLNPNANYAYKEKRLLSEAENRVKKAIGAKGGKVVFGGTSSQLIENLMNAVNDTFRWEDSQYMNLGSYVEHDSFNRYIEQTSADLESLDEWLSYYSDIQTFVLWQAVQNITGEIFPAKQIGALTHKYNGFYICDGTAQIGHISIEPNIDGWCDFYCFSGHKLGTELGIGCCWVSDRLDKWLNGFKLHGTPSLAGALALTQAVEDACDVKYLSVSTNRYNNLYDNLFYILKKHSIDFQVIDGNIKTCAINAIRLPGFNADALQQHLASKQIYVSIGGSACAELHDYRVLNAYGLSNDEASEVIRVSFGKDSSVEDVMALVDGIKNFKELYL
jgi:cysteine desulfurase